MLRVAEQYAATDTGRQRRANEDSLLARAPLYVVADGMGGAQAGEVASRIAIEAFDPGLSDGSQPELELATIAQGANSRIHELSHSNIEQAGMGTTLTAVYVGEREVAIAHVGDSRAYCLRDGELQRLTEDHSLVDELMRQGRLTPEEAVEHPQRSVITRALGPEEGVEVDTRSFRARDGDVYLLCSDGLTTMVGEEQIAEILRSHTSLREAGEALIAAANDAGGRDNITVVLVRLEEVGQAPGAGAGVEDAGLSDETRETRDAGHEQTEVGIPAIPPGAGAVGGATHAARVRERPAQAQVRTPPDRSPAAPGPPQRRMPRSAPVAKGPPSRRGRIRRAGVVALALAALGIVAAGAYLAEQSVYFIGTNNRGLVTMYEGLPYTLPGNLNLFSSRYVSGVSASTLTPEQRHHVLDHSLRSEAKAGSLIHSLELEQLE